MILIDVHEPIAILDELSKLGSKGQKLPLKTGDYYFFSHDAKKVLIERKTVTDLLNSLKDGSLQNQVERLVLESDYPFLLIEGYWTSTRDNFIKHTAGTSGWDWVKVQMYLTTIQLSGVYILYTTNHKTTAATVLGLYKYFQKKEHTSLSRARVLSIFPKDINARRVKFLSVIPGIGPEIAKRILDRFTGPANAILAWDEDLLAIRGIGDITLREWKSFLYPPLPEETLHETKKEEN